uniref:hypothetical protein n=1 Tax=Halomonas sp. TaxID=1486246 RepID=UPI00261413FA|nr:hypothetical protein [Halomonas sp.]
MSMDKSARPVGSPVRLSIMLGLMMVMALTLPRYIKEGHANQETLGWVVIAALALVSLLQWKLLDGEGRSRLKPLLLILIGCMVVGLAGTMLYKLMAGGAVLSVMTLSQGATAGLLLHAVALLLRKRR